MNFRRRCAPISCHYDDALSDLAIREDGKSLRYCDRYKNILTDSPDALRYRPASNGAKGFGLTSNRCTFHYCITNINAEARIIYTALARFPVYIIPERMMKIRETAHSHPQLITSRN